MIFLKILSTVFILYYQWYLFLILEVCLDLICLEKNISNICKHNDIQWKSEYKVYGHFVIALILFLVLCYLFLLTWGFA
jgi:hypothetical protein